MGAIGVGALADRLRTAAGGRHSRRPRDAVARENWWRYPPSEGWHLGYNCNRLPMEYHRHVERHGCIVRPTDEEILKDVGLLAR